MRRGVAFTLAASLLFLGCEPSTPQHSTSDESVGALTWAVGSVKGEIGLSRVENEVEDGVLNVRAWGGESVVDGTGRERLPVVLDAQLPLDRDIAAGDTGGPYGAIATIPRADPGIGEPIPIMKLIARDVSGVTEAWRCTLRGRREIICNEVHVMPWTATAERPTGGFRAIFGFN